MVMLLVLTPYQLLPSWMINATVRTYVIQISSQNTEKEGKKKGQFDRASTLANN